jgi:hypothetical protein
MGSIRKNDLQGQKINKLLVLGMSLKQDAKGSAYWWCQCDCGELACIRRDSLISGKRKSCGCLQKESKAKEVVVCLNCNKRFSAYKKENRKFCSVECKNEYNLRKYIKRECKNCGKVFFIRKSTLNTNASGNFCCRTCYNIYQKTLIKEKNNNCSGRWLPCAECELPVWVIKSREKEYKKHFCSVRCRTLFYSKELSGENNSNWRGGHVGRKGNFSSIKTRHFSGNIFCALCGKLKNLHIHHIVPYRHTQDNSLSNLIPLCKSCHRKVEILTWNIIDNCEGDFDMVKYMLNNILRSKQLATYEFVKEVAREVKNGSR